MDNFTHSLAGWALGQAGLKRKSRKGLAALILGANMPDIDVFFGWVPWEPLATHRGFTHGLVGGVLLMPPLLAALLWLLDRWQVKRGAIFKSGLSMDFRWLVALCYLGTLTHPLLDLQTNYSIQLLSPFSSLWFHTETLFIIDVWIWSALTFAIWLSRKRERTDGNWQQPARAALLATCIYIAANGLISLQARSTLLARIGKPQPEILIAGQEPVVFWRRSLIWRRDGAIGQASFDPLRSMTALQAMTPPIADNMSDPVVRAVLHQDASLRSFLRWSTMPMAQFVREKCGTRIFISDARFGTVPARGRMMRSVLVPGARPGC